LKTVRGNSWEFDDGDPGIHRSHLDTRTLTAWVEAEWLVPVASKKTLQFSEADLARARLIQDLKVDFGVNDEGISIVLHLLDQLYGAGYSRDGNARSRQGCRLTGGEAATISNEQSLAAWS
jgi:chaperone modulatory protein CbpM